MKPLLAHLGLQAPNDHSAAHTRGASPPAKRRVDAPPHSYAQQTSSRTAHTPHAANGRHVQVHQHTALTTHHRRSATATVNSRPRHTSLLRDPSPRERWLSSVLPTPHSSATLATHAATSSAHSASVAEPPLPHRLGLRRPSLEDPSADAYPEADASATAASVSLDASGTAKQRLPRPSCDGRRGSCSSCDGRRGGSVPQPAARGGSQPTSRGSTAEMGAARAAQLAGKLRHQSTADAPTSSECARSAAISAATATLSRAERSAYGVDIEDAVVIHVHDDSRRLNRDFWCSRQLLVSEMGYFEQHLGGERASDDVEISVHCDIHVFEWLMEYIHSTGIPPAIDVMSVVPIVISAEVLLMESLVAFALAFLKDNLSDVLRLNGDLSTLSEALIRRLATLFEPEELERVRDKKDKLLSSVYAMKTEQLLASSAGSLSKCINCSRLFTPAQRDWESCPKAPALVDFHGNAISEHLPSKSWDALRWVASLRRQKASAREVFWRVWSLTNFLQCGACDQPFPVAELDHCAYHPQPPSFRRHQASGVYDCCGAELARFNTGVASRKGGCMMRRHQVDASAHAPPGSSARDSSKLLATTLAFADVVLVPYTPPALVQPVAAPTAAAAVATASKPEATVHGDHADAEGEGEASDYEDDEETDEESVQLHRLVRTAINSDDDSPDDDDDSMRASSRSSSDSAASDSSDVEADNVAPPAQPRAVPPPSHVSSASSTAARAASTASRQPMARAPASRPTAGVNAESGLALSSPRGRGRNAEAPKSAWYLEAQMVDDKIRMESLCATLEAQRTAAGPVCKEVPTPEATPSLSGPKAFYLDRRFIMQIWRQSGAMSVVWPKTSANAVAQRPTPAFLAREGSVLPYYSLRHDQTPHNGGNAL